MTRLVAATLLAAALATAFAGPAAATPPDVVEPCRGDSYEWGVHVWVPGRDRPVPACVVQH